MAAQFLLICLVAVASWAHPVRGAVAPIGQPQLDSALQLAGKTGKGDIRMNNQKLPPESWLDKQDTIGNPPDCGTLLVQIFSPRARATRFAASAKQGVVRLDSVLWTPALFSAGVLMTAGGLNDSGRVIRVERVICALEGIVVEPLWTQIDSTVVTNRTGVRSMATRLQALFPLEPFNSGEDMEFQVFTNFGRREFRFSAREIERLH